MIPAPRTILVTGAGSGIGAAICRRVAASGINLLVHTGKRRERAAEVAADCTTKGALCQVETGDLAEPAGPTTTMDDPPKRIDYIWGIGVIGSSPHTVMALGASDHRAVVVNVTKLSRP